jgi:glycosyltransferase involved in cell wall biosynthesis
MLRVSVVMATFNGSRFIKTQLASLANQRELPAELIISDDCSSDDTIGIVREFATKAPFPVRIHINEKRKGYRRNFVDATALCSSELLAFCDQDDIWHEEKLFCIARLFSNNHDVILAYHNARIIDSNDGFVGRLWPAGFCPPISRPLSLNPWFYTLGFALAFRRVLTMFSYLNVTSVDHKFPDQNLAHDQWFFFLGSVLGAAAYLDQDLVDYRQHEMNVFGLPIEEPKARRKIIETISLRLEQRGEYFAQWATFAVNRALILNNIADNKQCPLALRHNAHNGAIQYQRLSDWFSLRAQMYQCRRRLKRLVAWRNMVKCEGYTNINWAFSKRSAVRDLLLGVTLGPRFDWLYVLIKGIADKGKLFM